MEVHSLTLSHVTAPRKPTDDLAATTRSGSRPLWVPVGTLAVFFGSVADGYAKLHLLLG